METSVHTVCCVCRLLPTAVLPVSWGWNTVAKHTIKANCGDVLRFSWPQGSSHNVVEVKSGVYVGVGLVGPHLVWGA